MALSKSELLDLNDAIEPHLDAILKLFKPGAKITLVIRNPKFGQDAGILMGDDDPMEVIKEIRRQCKRPPDLEPTKQTLTSKGPHGTSTETSV